jgi:hypothetical protein
MHWHHFHWLRIIKLFPVSRIFFPTTHAHAHLGYLWLRLIWVSTLPPHPNPPPHLPVFGFFVSKFTCLLNGHT